MTPPEDAIRTITDRVVVNHLEPVVDAIWAIIADIQDSYTLAIEAALTGVVDARDVIGIISEANGTVDDYVVNHYGIEEFGL